MARDDDHWVTVEAESKSIDEIHQVILEKVVNYMSDDVEKVDMSKMANSLFVQWKREAFEATLTINIQKRKFILNVIKA